MSSCSLVHILLLSFLFFPVFVVNSLEVPSVLGTMLPSSPPITATPIDVISIIFASWHASVGAFEYLTYSDMCCRQSLSQCSIRGVLGPQYLHHTLHQPVLLASFSMLMKWVSTNTLLGWLLFLDKLSCGKKYRRRDGEKNFNHSLLLQKWSNLWLQWSGKVLGNFSILPFLPKLPSDICQLLAGKRCGRIAILLGAATVNSAVQGVTSPLQCGTWLGTLLHAYSCYIVPIPLCTKVIFSWCTWLWKNTSSFTEFLGHMSWSYLLLHQLGKSLLELRKCMCSLNI